MSPRKSLRPLLDHAEIIDGRQNTRRHQSGCTLDLASQTACCAGGGTV